MADESGLSVPAAHAPTASIAALQESGIVKSFDSDMLADPSAESHERSETVLAVEDQKIVSSRLGVFREYDRTPKVKDTIAEEESDGTAAAAASAAPVTSTVSDTPSAMMMTASGISDGSGDSWVNLETGGGTGSGSSSAAAPSAIGSATDASASTFTDDAAAAAVSQSSSSDTAAVTASGMSEDGFLQISSGGIGSRESGSHDRMTTAIMVGGPAEVLLASEADDGSDDDDDEPVLLTSVGEADVVTVEEAEAKHDASAAAAVVDSDVAAGYGGDGYADADASMATELDKWEAQRRKVLADRRANEERLQRERLSAAAQFKENLKEERMKAVAKSRAEKSGMESDIRAELASVFDRGSIWEQVARMVDLTKVDPRTERMRNLIITLKSEGR